MFSADLGFHCLLLLILSAALVVVLWNDLETIFLRISRNDALCDIVFHGLLQGHAISWNGTELVRNVPQDSKTRNDHFNNYNKHLYT